MKLKSIIYSLTTVLLASCVGENLVFSGPDSANNLTFDRRLLSVAFDESPQIVLRNNGEVLDLENGDFNVLFSSSDTSFLQIDQTGKITIKEAGIGETVDVSVSFAPKAETEIDDSEVPEPITDDITIGAVTISEAEARGIDNIDEIVANGYEPKISINENFREIDINTTNQLKLTAIFQGIKREVIENTVFNWNSSNTDVLTISNDGVITPISLGETTISVSTEFEGETFDFEKNLIVGGETAEEEPEEEPQPTKEVLAFGDLQTNSQYVVNGEFEIFTENGKSFITLSDDFDTRNGRSQVPDLTIYLSNSTTSNGGDAQLIAAPETGLATFGAQTFEIPDDININDFQNVLLFCRRFGVRVGFGVITR